MLIQVRITSADGEVRGVAMEPGESLPVLPGDQIELVDMDRDDVEIGRDGDSVTITAANGEQYILEDFALYLETGAPALLAFDGGAADSFIVSQDAAPVLIITVNGQSREIQIVEGQEIEIPAGAQLELANVDPDLADIILDGDNVIIQTQSGLSFVLLGLGAALDAGTVLTFSGGVEELKFASFADLLDQTSPAPGPGGAAPAGPGTGGTFRADGDLFDDGVPPARVGADGPGQGIGPAGIPPFTIDPTFGIESGGTAVPNIFVDDVQAGLQLSTSGSGNETQFVQVTLTEIGNAQPPVGDTSALASMTAQQEIALDFGAGITLDPEQSYTITVDHISGTNTFDITGLNLLDLNGDLVFGVNPFAPPSDNLDFALGTTGNNYDGGLYFLDPTATANDFDWDVAPALGYVKDSSTLRLETSQSGQNDFNIDLGDLVVGQLDNLDTIDIAGEIDGTGKPQEDNTLTLSVQDVLDFVGDNGTLLLVGDTEDTVTAENAGDWTFVETTGGFDVFTGSVNTMSVTLQIESDMQSNLDSIVA